MKARETLREKKMVGMGWFLCMMMMVWVISCGEALPAAKFEELYRSSWAMDHCVNDGQVTKLKLDKFSGTYRNKPLSPSLCFVCSVSSGVSEC